MILYLGILNSKITKFFDLNNISYISTDDKIIPELIINNNINLIISYRYKFIIKKNIIDLNIRIINLHISYLPWNRGADPNLWSIIDNTKKGITIHYIDAGIDTGDIIYQREINFKDDDTLESSYNKLNDIIQDTFIDRFNDILNNTCSRVKQDKNAGSFHYSKDKNNIMNIINNNGGWKIKINHLINLLKNNKNI
jgi:methionyl-tRNA formyltransferase